MNGYPKLDRAMKKLLSALLLIAAATMSGAAGAPAAWAQSSPSSFTTGHRYDAGGRPTGVIQPRPATSGPINYAAARTTYDSDGRVWKVEKGELQTWQAETILPANWTGFTIFQTVTFTYDSRGRKIKETTSGSDNNVYQVTQYSYDDADRPLCTATRMNPAAFASQLPADACALGPQGSQGPDRVTKNSYNTLGELLTVKRAVGTPLEQNYSTFEYSYSGLASLDKPVSITDANGNKTTMVYGGSSFNHVTRVTFPSPSVAGQSNVNDYEAYTYDANGNRTSERKRNGSVINYSYDSLGRVTLKDIPGGTAADVYYGYDLRGLQLHARFGSPSGAGITSTYDGFGRQTSTSNNMSGTPRTLLYEWDADGNRTRITHPDNVYFTYEYDGLNRNTAIKENGATVIATLSYDAQGRRSGETRGAVSATYGYDAVSRLASLSNDLSGTGDDVVTTLSYNPANQIVSRARNNDSYAFDAYPGTAISRPYVPNGLNQYSNVAGANFTYDVNGNLISDGTTTYTYDVENRLLTGSGPVPTTLQYDPLGRLWRVVLPQKTQEFTYDGDALIGETASDATYRYVHGNGIDDPLIWYSGTGLGDRRSLQVDSKGSIVSVANASGVRTAINSYDEYGIPGLTYSGRFLYTGQIYIPPLGMYYYKARMYSPTLGRFLQTDPIGYQDQNNLYAYVGNDPITAKDPTGKDTVVELLGYTIGQIPIIGGDYGHTYVRVTDTRTGESYIFRGGPSEGEISNGFSAAASNTGARDQNGAAMTVFVQVDRTRDSPDTFFSRQKGGSEVLQRVNLGDKPIGEVVGALEGVRDRTNNRDLPYIPRSLNSNNVAGVGFTEVTGQAVSRNPKYPGLGSPLEPPKPPPTPPYDRCRVRPGSC